MQLRASHAGLCAAIGETDGHAGSRDHAVTPDEFFADKTLAQELFEVVRREVEAVGEASIRVTRSQITFGRRRSFAWVWMPGQYLRGRVAPLVLTVFLPWRDGSPRWKEVVEPVPGWLAAAGMGLGRLTSRCSSSSASGCQWPRISQVSLLLPVRVRSNAPLSACQRQQHALRPTLTLVLSVTYGRIDGASPFVQGDAACSPSGI